jgi:crossover junction endodeoxyribonuclease RuvC
VVESTRGRLAHIAHGVIRAEGHGSLELRLLCIFEALAGALATHRPDAVAVEGLFSFKNARSALVLGHARGVALLAAARSGLPVHEYSPAHVKKAIGAGGAGGKDAVARMVRTFLSLETFERADASDALAVAICHLNQASRPRPVLSAPGRGADGLSRNTLRGRPSRRAAANDLAARLRPAYQKFSEER